MSTHIENIDLHLNQFDSGIVTIAQRGDQFIVIPPENLATLALFFAEAARNVVTMRLKASRIKRCPHGAPLGECAACDQAGDYAFDAAREDRIFGR